ncbi:hypothetical protein HHC20_08835 [Neisseria meningitidis]|uniref:hypothetical protein n=1 Tax=Neisseria meningitidis TaxID=487 RepID=UPI000FCBD5D1|nr:hypothetical protein [Neisseria meningitidis]MBW3882596.1 hypothetical protein [Neisseria meningitidis]MBW3933032.1 hypothetical protein [Neisseria meningitidis]
MNIFVTDFSYRFMSLLILSYIPSIHSSDDDIDFGKRVMMVTFFAFLDTVIERFFNKKPWWFYPAKAFSLLQT